MLSLLRRPFSTSSCRPLFLTEFDKKKIFFGRLKLYNKRHLPEHKKKLFKKFQQTPQLPFPTTNYGCRGTGIRHQMGWEAVSEMVPELIVPDLADFKLKPYVSYRTKEIVQEELTAKDLFNVVYGSKIVRDFKENKLDQNGNAKEPSDVEKLTAEEAYNAARKTGSDIFQGGEERDPRFKLRYKRH